MASEGSNETLDIVGGVDEGIDLNISSEHDSSSSNPTDSTDGSSSEKNSDSVVESFLSSDLEGNTNINNVVFSSIDEAESKVKWLGVRSSISMGRVALISKKYHIPSDFQIAIPGSDDCIHTPPRNFRTFQIAHLMAGLRFPLHPFIVTFLNRLRLCPSQLLPNSYRHFAYFIVLMSVYGADANLENFKALFTVNRCSSVSEIGYYYISPRKGCRLQANPKDSYGTWKDKYFYLALPGLEPWGVSRVWNLDAPVGLSRVGKPTIPEPKLEELLRWYYKSDILNEPMLRACGLSVADVTPCCDIAMAARAAKMERKMIENQEAAKKKGSGGSKKQTARGISIEKPSDPQIDSNKTSGSKTPIITAPPKQTAPDAPARKRPAPPAADPRPTKKDSSSSKKTGSTSRSEASSSAGPSFIAPPPGFYDTSNQRGMTEALSLLEARSLHDFEELKIAERGPIDSEKRKVRMSPRIYEDSSVLLDKTEDIAMELYIHNMLPRDRTILLKHAHPWVEKHGASLTNQVNLCMHQLSLTCSHYKHEGEAIAKKFQEYRNSVSTKLATAEEIQKKHELDQKKYEAMLDEVKRAKMKEKEMKEKISKLESTVEQTRTLHEAEKKKVFEEGINEGVKQYSTSPQLMARLNSVAVEARRTGVKEFLKSDQMDNLLISKAVNDQYDGFYKAVDYLKKIDGFKPTIIIDEFVEEYLNKGLLRPSVTEDDSGELIDVPEFQQLIEEVEEERKSRASTGFMLQLTDITDRGGGNEVKVIEHEQITMESVEREARLMPPIQENEFTASELDALIEDGKESHHTVEDVAKGDS